MSFRGREKTRDSEGNGIASFIFLVYLRFFYFLFLLYLSEGGMGGICFGMDLNGLVWVFPTLIGRNY